MEKYLRGFIVLFLAILVDFACFTNPRFAGSTTAAGPNRTNTIPAAFIEQPAAYKPNQPASSFVLDSPLSPDDLPLLSICADGLSFCRGDAPVLLRGVNLPNLIFADTAFSFGSLDLFKEDVQIIKDWGANFVIVSYDPERISGYAYATKIVEAVEYSRNLGLYVELMQHHAKVDLVTDEIIHLTVKDEGTGAFSTDVLRRWIDFLSHPGFAGRLSRSVDLFGIYSEPSDISWKRWRPRAEKACLDIRGRIQREAICSISGVNWGWDIRGLQHDPFQVQSVAAEVHNYYGHEFRLDREWNWERLVGKVPILVGEFGFTDPPRYIQGLLSELREKQIGWAAWPGAPLLWSEVPSLDNLIREELSR